MNFTDKELALIHKSVTERIARLKIAIIEADQGLRYQLSKSHIQSIDYHIEKLNNEWKDLEGITQKIATNQNKILLTP